MSVGSCSSTIRMPSPIACGVPAGTNTTSPAATSSSCIASSIAPASCVRIHPRQLAQLDVALERGVHRGAALGLDDPPRLRLAVAAAERLAGEGPAGVEVHGQALAGVEQLDEQRRVGAEAGDVLGAEVGLRVGRMASRTSVPSSSRLSPRSSSPKVVLTAPSHSSGMWSESSSIPRSAAIRGPPA